MAGKGGEHAVNKISVQYDAAKVSMSTRNCHYAEGGSWLRECGGSRPAEAISRDWRDPKCDGEIQTHTQTHTHIHRGKQVQSQKVENPSVYWSEWTQSCPTLCDCMDDTVYEILQARILEWVGIPFSRGSSKPRD